MGLHCHLHPLLVPQNVQKTLQTLNRGTAADWPLYAQINYEICASSQLMSYSEGRKEMSASLKLHARRAGTMTASSAMATRWLPSCRKTEAGTCQTNILGSKGRRHHCPADFFFFFLRCISYAMTRGTYKKARPVSLQKAFCLSWLSVKAGQ